MSIVKKTSGLFVLLSNICIIGLSTEGNIVSIITFTFHGGFGEDQNEELAHNKNECPHIIEMYEGSLLL